MLYNHEDQSREAVKQKILCAEQAYIDVTFDPTRSLPGPLAWVAPNAAPLNVDKVAGSTDFGGYIPDPKNNGKMTRACVTARAPRPFWPRVRFCRTRLAVD